MESYPEMLVPSVTFWSLKLPTCPCLTPTQNWILDGEAKLSSKMHTGKRNKKKSFISIKAEITMYYKGMGLGVYVPTSTLPF